MPGSMYIVCKKMLITSDWYELGAETFEGNTTSKGGDSSYGCCLLTRPYGHDGRNTSKEDTDREMVLEPASRVEGLEF
jgi:hypothetical protein